MEGEVAGLSYVCEDRVDSVPRLLLPKDNRMLQGTYSSFGGEDAIKIAIKIDIVMN